jgi:uncharacterized protein YggT (Ycf19 family)
MMRKGKKMTLKMRERKVRQLTRPQLDDSNETVKRWQQSQVILKGSRRHPVPITKITTVQRQPNLAKIKHCVWLLAAPMTLLLVARIGIKLITLNPGTPVGHFVMGLTNLLLRPFSSMTETMSGPHMAMLELSTLTAVIIYPFAAWCLINFLQLIYPHQAK